MYDHRCVDCRNAPTSLKILKQRVELGLLTRAEFDREEARRKQQRLLGRKEAKEERNAHTWEKAERSARMAIKVLTAMPCANEAEHEWRESLRELVYGVLTNIAANKRAMRPPNERYLFWYDIDADTAARARKLINDYPGDKECAPIKMM